MKLISMLVAITPNFLSTLYQQTIGSLRPIDINSVFRQPTVMEDTVHYPSCPTSPPLSTTERTEFHTGGCMVYGYPSSGGVLIKEADLLDMVFLSLSRFNESQRSPSVDEEDKFCHLMRRTGATLWSSRDDWIEVQIGSREITEEEDKVVVFGWPTDGVGVWVLRFASAGQRPKGFARLSLALNMEEKIQMMREYGATFVEDDTQVEELCDG